MAILIPEKPHQFDPASQEGLMFDALKLLSDDYYVYTAKIKKPKKELASALNAIGSAENPQ